MSNDIITVNGVSINKADIKRTVTENGKEYIELKNGVKINIWRGMPDGGEKPYIRIDKDNKTQIGNVLCGGIIGTQGADDIVITNSSFMGNIDLKDGDDRLSLTDTTARGITGGEGNDTVIFNNSRLIDSVDAEQITFENHSSAHGKVKGKNVLFINNSSSFNEVTAENVKYRKQFTK